MVEVPKWPAIVIVGLVALGVAGGYASSPKFRAERSTSIDASADKIYARIADPRGWQCWSMWGVSATRASR